MEFSHKSVLLEETIEGLAIKPEGIYVDGTLGGAGHSSVIAGRLSGQGHLIGIDQDAAAIAAATERLQPCTGVRNHPQHRELLQPVPSLHTACPDLRSLLF